MAINNFESVKTMLNFENANTMYMIQILQRKKDNPDLTKNVKRLSFYYLRCLEDFDKLKEKIIDECTRTNSRAYIDLNSKNMENVALLTLKKVADHIFNKEYDAVKNAYEFACGNASGFNSKLWLVDIDTKEQQTIDLVSKQLISLGSEIKLTLNSKNGCHILMTPFPLNKFDPIADVSIIKHGMTILYVPDSGPIHS